MSVTQADLLAGVLPVVISGGRPALKQRPVSKLLPGLHGVTSDPVWVVIDEQAAGYERDGHEIVTYTRAWAEKYAAAHWTALTPPEPGGFMGAFPGREWACRTAEERGYWAVLQLDDNIDRIGCFNTHAPAIRLIRQRGGLGLFADVLASVTLSTNGWMTGAFLSSVNPHYKFYVALPGFPYSLFLERVGPGREAWHGPFEDDITHAYQYAYNATQATALVVRPLNYKKESKSGSGMRAHYNHERSVSLQRMFPETAKIAVLKKKSNGLGEPRVFHKMAGGSLRTRTPLVITDSVLFEAVKTYLLELAAEWYADHSAAMRARVARRAVKAAQT